MTYLTLAALALERYDIDRPEVAFIRHNENITFRVVERADSAAYLLRMHRPISTNYVGMRQHPQAILSELRWLEALTIETPLTVQQPVANRHDDYVTLLPVEGSVVPCTLLRWVEGETFRQDAPNAATLAEQLGGVIACLHNHAERWEPPPGFIRPTYDVAYFRRQPSLLLPGVEAGVISVDDQRIMEETVEAILALVEPLGAHRDRWGLIHTDLQGSNILARHDDIRPIDFSLCGFGFFLFDLGTTLPSLKRELRASFLAGYCAHRRFDDTDLRLVDGFFLLSRLGAYVFMPADPATQAWLHERIPRFVANECGMFLRGRPLLFE